MCLQVLSVFLIWLFSHELWRATWQLWCKRLSPAPVPIWGSAVASPNGPRPCPVCAAQRQGGSIKPAICNPLNSLHMFLAVTCPSVLQGVPVCTATCAQLHKRAEKITATLMERGGLNTGDNVVLLYPPGERTSLSSLCLFLPFLSLPVLCAHQAHLAPSRTGIDLIAAFYGCLYAGVIPVTVRPPHPQNLAATLPTVRMIIDVSQLFLHRWTDAIIREL